MPIYCYKCDICGHECEEFQHISEEPLPTCPECTSTGFHRVPTLTHTDMKEFHKPIEMHSLGLAHLDEIQAFRQRNPGVKVSSDVNDPLYGVPIAHHRKEKLDILAKEGWEEKERRK